MTICVTYLVTKRQISPWQWQYAREAWKAPQPRSGDCYIFGLLYVFIIFEVLDKFNTFIMFNVLGVFVNLSIFSKLNLFDIFLFTSYK